MSHFAIPMGPPPLIRLLESSADGAGQEVATIEQLAYDVREAYANSLAVTYRQIALASVLQQLSEKWRQATRYQSSLMRAASHPAYRAIVGLGNEVVPLLLRELQRHREPWVTLALREITGDDPVAAGDRGNLRAVTDAWLRWGRNHRLI